MYLISSAGFRRPSRVLALFLTALVSARLLTLAGDLEVRFLNVGQADAILVTCPDGDHHLLIDSDRKRGQVHFIDRSGLNG